MHDIVVKCEIGMTDDGPFSEFVKTAGRNTAALSKKLNTSVATFPIEYF